MDSRPLILLAVPVGVAVYIPLYTWLLVGMGRVGDVLSE
jgi:hypothetical protein